MTDVFLEREFEPPIDGPVLIDLATESNGCFETHDVDWHGSYLSGDGRRIFSVSQNGSARIYDRDLERVTERFGDRPIAIGDFDAEGRLHRLDCLGVAHAEPAGTAQG